MTPVPNAMPKKTTTPPNTGTGSRCSLRRPGLSVMPLSLATRTICGCRHSADRNAAKNAVKGSSMFAAGMGGIVINTMDMFLHLVTCFSPIRPFNQQTLSVAVLDSGRYALYSSPCISSVRRMHSRSRTTDMQCNHSSLPRGYCAACCLADSAISLTNLRFGVPMPHIIIS